MRNTLLALALVASMSAADSDYQQIDQSAMYGVNMTPTSSTAQQREGLDPSVGVEVQTVYPGTAADRAGLQDGDVILSFNGSDINSMTDLRNEVALAGVGGPANVVVSRGGQRITTNQTLGEWPKDIPFQPIDDAAERRFREWQSHRLDRTQQAVVSMRQKVEDLERATAAKSKPKSGGKVTNPLDALGMPVGDALAALPPWKLTLSIAHDVSAPGVAPQTQPAWDARVLLGTPAPDIL
jgi:membrane-associated protease RseP (regulator of RpoE activity)